MFEVKLNVITDWVTAIITHRSSVAAVACLVCIFDSATAACSAEFVCRGQVESRIYFYDVNGAPTNPPPDFRSPTVSDFVYWRKGAAWRLDIQHQDTTYPSDVVIWRSLMPSPEGGLISIISYPPRPDATNKANNAYVDILTNKFLPFDESYGARQVWLEFNLKELLSANLITNACPHFWKFNPNLDFAGVNNYTVSRTNGTVEFRCLGFHPLKNPESGSWIQEDGKPKLVDYPPPFDKGFLEAVYRPSSNFLSAALGIPRSSLFVEYTPTKDISSPGHVKLVRLAEFNVKNSSMDFGAVPSSKFEPSWTNSFAVINDHRANVTADRSLTYFSRSKELNLSQAEKDRQLNHIRMLQRNYDYEHRPFGVRALVFLVMITGPLVIFIALRMIFRLKKSRKDAGQ